jgi:hypothetical protein
MRDAVVARGERADSMGRGIPRAAPCFEIPHMRFGNTPIVAGVFDVALVRFEIAVIVAAGLAIRLFA